MLFLSIVKNLKVLYDRYIDTRPIHPKINYKNISKKLFINKRTTYDNNYP